MSGAQIYPDGCFCAKWARLARSRELLVKWECPDHGRMLIDGRKCIHHVEITKESPK